MCGIGGVIMTKHRDAEAYEGVIRNLLTGMASRGTDAGGVAVIDMKTKATRVVKEAGSPVALAKRVDLKEQPGDIVLLHSRMKTHGEPTNPYNNHPIVSKSGAVLVHNGIVSNYKEIIEKYQLTCDGEVDSEVILRLYEKMGIKGAIGKISGCNAFVLADPRQKKAYFYASGNPLHIALLPKEDLILFASEQGHIEEAVGKKVYNFFTQAEGLITYKLDTDCLATFDFKKMTFKDTEIVREDDDWHYVPMSTYYDSKLTTDKEADRLISEEAKYDKYMESQYGRYYGF